MATDDAGWTPPAWEPPLAGSEPEHLLGALDRQRATFRWKADGLDDVGLDLRIGASTMSLGGLLLHLSAVEVLCSTWRVDGSPPLGPWDPSTWDEPDGWAATFDTAGRTPAELYQLYDSCVASARDRFTAAVARGGLDQPAAISAPDGTPISLRRLLFDLLEEYGRHTGHADLLREAVDGRTGEDPPPEWTPPFPTQ